MTAPLALAQNVPRPALTLYVAYHDSRPHPVPGQRPYVALCNVDRDGRRPEGYRHYDDEGGLPAKNDMYCELSALRHLETHGPGEYLGLSHYRRVFVTKRSVRRYAPHTYWLSSWDWADVARHGATEEALLAAVSGRDWCTAPPYDVRWSGQSSLWEQFCIYHPEASLVTLCRVVDELHSELPAFGEYMRRSRSMPFFNMFIARRQWVREYGEWLWPILAECERRIGIPESPYQRRYLGFFAERLHGYWLATVGRASGLRIGQLPVAILDPDGIVNTRTGDATGAGARRSRRVDLGQWPQSAIRSAPFGLRFAVNRVRRSLPGPRGR